MPPQGVISLLFNDFSNFGDAIIWTSDLSPKIYKKEVD